MADVVLQLYFSVAVPMCAVKVILMSKVGTNMERTGGSSSTACSRLFQSRYMMLELLSSFTSEVCFHVTFICSHNFRFSPDTTFAMQAKAALERLPIVAQFSVPSYSGKKGISVFKVRLNNN